MFGLTYLIFKKAGVLSDNFTKQVAYFIMFVLNKNQRASEAISGFLSSAVKLRVMILTDQY